MSSNLRKCFSMQPLGFINPGGPYSYADAAGRNVQWFKDTGTRWVRLWVDWLTLEPNYNQYDENRLNGLDEQIRRARANGVQAMLTVNPRFPCWVTNRCNDNPFDPAWSPTDFGWDSAYKRFIDMLYNRYKPFYPATPWVL